MSFSNVKVLKSDKIVDENGFHEYKVVIGTNQGCFTGSVKIHQEDLDVAIDTRGYEYAERKAYIKSLGVKSRDFKQRLIEAQRLYNVFLEKYGDCQFVKDLAYQVEIAEREFERVHAQYTYMKADFKAYIDRCNKYRAHIVNKYHNEEN